MYALGVTSMRAWLRSRFRRGQRGANLVEYVLLIALLSVAVAMAVQFAGCSAALKLIQVGSAVDGAGS